MKRVIYSPSKTSWLFQTSEFKKFQPIPINVESDMQQYSVWQNLRAVLKTDKPSCFYSFHIQEVVFFMCFCRAMPLMWHPIISWKDEGFDSNMTAWFHIHPEHICTCNFVSADLHGSIKDPFSACWSWTIRKLLSEMAEDTSDSSTNCWQHYWSNYKMVALVCLYSCGGPFQPFVLSTIMPPFASPCKMMPEQYWPVLA